MVKLKDRYANALFEISEEHGTISEDQEQVNFIKHALNSSRTTSFLLNPAVSVPQKIEFLDNIFENKISVYMTSFLHMMIQNGHGSIIVSALDEYTKLAKHHIGVLEAKVVSARPLENEQMDRIREIIKKKAHMDVEIAYDVNPDIIGGFYFMIGDRIFDATVRSELLKMKESLKKGSSEW